MTEKISEKADMGPLEATVTILSSQAIRFGDVGALTTAITEVYKAITGLGAPPEAAPEEELKPAVPIRKSVTPDYIVCLEDGRKFKSMKRHIRNVYDLSPEAYRERWGLPADYPMTAPNYSAHRSRLAKDSGLGKKV